jgi:hypothetical protein
MDETLLELYIVQRMAPMSTGYIIMKLAYVLGGLG